MPKKAETEKKEETKAEKKSEKISESEFEKKVIELADKGMTAEKIGETLKRQGIHSKDYSKKISQILGHKYKSPDMENISSKLAKLDEHVKNNHGDKRAIREKGRIFAQLKRLKEYLSK
jgi:ribosomal protein S15P/S13E